MNTNKHFWIAGQILVVTFVVVLSVVAVSGVARADCLVGSPDCGGPTNDQVNAGLVDPPVTPAAPAAAAPATIQDSLKATADAATLALPGAMLQTTDGKSVSALPSNTGGTFSISNPLNVNSVADVVSSGAQIFSYIVVLFGVLALIWTGLQYILAQGNSARITELKMQLLWIVIGIAIVIGARIIISIVINTLAATGVVNQRIIQSSTNALNRQ